VQRLLDSCKIARLDLPYLYDELMEATRETVRRNGGKACYIRPIVYRGYETLGVNPLGNPVDSAIILWEWGAYLGKEALEVGVDMKISSWSRMAPNTLPAMAKSTANYANSQLIKMEALADGYSEGIALDVFGNISEGSGQNIFIVRDGVILTPPQTASILDGINRKSIIQIARDLGFEVVERDLARAELYLADEVFVSGTAAELTPLREIDDHAVGEGRPGEITRAVQAAFEDALHGRSERYREWLDPVPVPSPAPQVA